MAVLRERDMPSSRRGGRGQAAVGDGGVSAVPLLVEPSFIGLRQRGVRYWLAGLGLLGFAIPYVAPIGAALRRPGPAPAIVLPKLGLPVIDFPMFAVPSLQPPGPLRVVR